jgi:hypothetical protein
MGDSNLQLSVSDISEKFDIAMGRAISGTQSFTKGIMGNYVAFSVG